MLQTIIFSLSYFSFLFLFVFLSFFLSFFYYFIFFPFLFFSFLFSFFFYLYFLSFFLSFFLIFCLISFSFDPTLPNSPKERPSIHFTCSCSCHVPPPGRSFLPLFSSLYALNARSPGTHVMYAPYIPACSLRTFRPPIVMSTEVQQ